MEAIKEFGSERTRRVLEEYLSDTRHLGWMSGSTPPLEWEEVIAVYEENGAVKHLRAHYSARQGWSAPRLQEDAFFWIYGRRL